MRKGMFVPRKEESLRNGDFQRTLKEVTDTIAGCGDRTGALSTLGEKEFIISVNKLLGALGQLQRTPQNIDGNLQKALERLDRALSFQRERISRGEMLTTPNFLDTFLKLHRQTEALLTLLEPVLEPVPPEVIAASEDLRDHLKGVELSRPPRPTNGDKKGRKKAPKRPKGEAPEGHEPARTEFISFKEIGRDPAGAKTAHWSSAGLIAFVGKGAKIGSGEIEALGTEELINILEKTLRTSVLQGTKVNWVQIELYVAALFKAFKDDTFMSLEKKRLMKIQNAIGSLQPQGRLIRPAMRSMGMMVRITEAFADDEDVKNASYHDEVEVALSNADDIEVAQKRITKILNQLMEMMKSPLAYTVLPTLASLTESLTQHADDLTDEHYADIRPIILKLGEYRGQNPLINKCASRLEALLPKETPKPEPLAAEKAGGLLGNLFSYLKRS